jgi:hypothetical protein
MSLYRVPPDGIIVCLDHVKQLWQMGSFHGDGARVLEDLAICALCTSGVNREGRVCHRDECEKPLHPQWPAVYCCNACAFADA